MIKHKDTNLFMYYLKNSRKAQSIKRCDEYYTMPARLIYSANCGQCPLCETPGYHWKDENDYKWKPRCESSTVHEEDITCESLGIETRVNVSTEELGVIIFKGPVYKNKGDESDRIKSYVTWPRSYPQNHTKLAHAGFFDTGVEDRTLCFYCGGGLRNWTNIDEPCQKHSQLFTECAFIKAKTWAKSSTNQQISEHCPVCKKNQRGIVFLPCKHCVVCKQCGNNLKNCILCNEPIKGTITPFFS